MKRHAMYQRLVVILLILCCLLLSCTGEQPGLPATTQQTGTEYEADTVDSADMTAISGTEITKDITETVPSFVPYTLQYTIVDLTEQLPDQIINSHGGLYKEEYELNYSNTCAKDGKLYIYGQQKTENGRAGYLYAYADGVRAEEIPVPLIHGALPEYAYILSDGCFALIWCERKDGDTLYYFGISEPDGTLRAEICLYEVYPDFWTNGDFIISEIEEGDVVLLHRGESSCFFSIEYDHEKQTMTVGRKVYQQQQNIYKHLSFMDYIGDMKWLPVWSVGECSILNMKTGIYEDKKFRVPDDKDHMNLTADAQGNLYLYDMLGMYAYRDNLSPVKVADWVECGITVDLSYRNLWVVDEQNFYITKSKFVNNRYTETKLYYIHTEMVPDENPKQVIDLDYYGLDEWVRESVIAFNRESAEYEINLNYIDIVNVGQEQVEAMIADRMLNRAHPDVILIDQRVSLENYYDKNTFLDLTPYIGDQLLGCVTDAVGWGDALYAVPMNMQVYTFVCLP